MRTSLHVSVIGDGWNWLLLGGGTIIGLGSLLTLILFG
jgi:hypothetical protein